MRLACLAMAFSAIADFLEREKVCSELIAFRKIVAAASPTEEFGLSMAAWVRICRVT